MVLGKLHVLLVHFPIALALSAALADILWAIWRRDFFRHAGFYCLILAALAVIPTVITGDLHLDAQHFKPATQAIAETHEGLGIATLCVLVPTAVLRAVRRNRPRRWWLACYVVMMVAVVVLVSLTGHWGGMVTFGPDYLRGLL